MNDKGSYDKRISQKFSIDLLQLILKDQDLPFGLQSMQTMQNLPVKFTEFLNKEMDFVYLITKPNGEKAILHIEVQSSNDGSMRQRMLLYLGILRFQYPKIKHYQICIYMGNDDCTIESVDNINEELKYFYYLVSFKDIPYEEFLKNPKTIGFSVLGDFHQEDEDVVLQNIFDSISKIPDPKVQENLISDLIIFGNLCNLTEKIKNKLIEDMIIDITTNPVYIEALEKGIEKGMEKGIEKGMEKGILEGMEKGMEKGILKGMEKGMEKGILKGMEKGIQKANHTFAKKMLGDGLSIDVVHKYTGLSNDELHDLMDEIKSEKGQ